MSLTITDAQKKQFNEEGYFLLENVFTPGDPDQGVLVPVKAGSLAVFQSLTMHKSGANVSKGTRKAYVIQYSAADLRHADTGELVDSKIALARGGVGVPIPGSLTFVPSRSLPSEGRAYKQNGG